MDGACFADTLGAVLAVADYLSRKSVPDASPAVTVHDLLRVSIKAREIQRCLARAGDFDHASCVMIAAAAVSAAMLGASSAHVAAALALAGQRARPRDAASGAQQRWVAGEAVGQGVRLALLALAGSHAGHIVAPAAGLEVAGVPGEDSPCVAPPEQVREAGAQALRELETAVAAHFSPAQAGKLHAVLADRARVMALPVHEFVSLLVRN
jgi:2-methylcitrate dehydratase PrpD